MRWWLALAVVAGVAGPARARKIVVMEPPLVRACQTVPSWPKLVDCLQQHGLAGTIVRTLDDAKLVQIEEAGSKTHAVEAFAIYVAKGKGWKLGGLVETGSVSSDYEIQRFEHVTSGTYHGYRVDLASSQPSGVSVDLVTTLPSLYRQTQAVFCNGASYNCLQLVQSCAMIVFGQAYQVFDGAVDVVGTRVKITGHGSLPRSCSNAGEYSLQ